MGIARDLVELEFLLRESGVDPFVSAERSGLLQSPAANAVISHMSGANFGDPVNVMQLCLQALRVQHSELAPETTSAELVATVPPEMPALARTTEQVVREMLRSSVSEVILLGYEFNDANLLTHLARTVSQGATVIMICDRARKTAQRILEEWPDNTRPPRLFQDRERDGRAPHASMHAKCLLVDSRDLLITSANFTFHGLRGNIEIGVRLSGPAAAEAREIFSHLVEQRIVEEVR